MKILITGSNGYIGKSLYNKLYKKYDITTLSRKDLDLTCFNSVNNFFENRYFDIILHCAVEGGNRLKHDTYDVLDNNLKMYYNLISHKNKFKKFIHFGSGAELFAQNTPYGLSKHVIKESILEKNNFYNLRIFAVFDENELDSRFIKSNIKRYINKESIIIHDDKFMDFFYMEDLILLVEKYINNDNLNKEIECIYNNPYKLSDIANFINNLEEYKVDIIIENNNSKNYIGEYNNLEMEYYGLVEGIKKVYNFLKS